MTARTKSIISETSASLLILLYVYAASSKLLDYERYVKSMRNQPFDDRLTYWLVWGVPAVELVIAAMLFSKLWRHRGFLYSLILMSLFTGYIGLVLSGAFGRIPCSCGGVLSQLDWGPHLYFNLFFVAISAWGFWVTRKNSNTSDIGDGQMKLSL